MILPLAIPHSNLDSSPLHDSPSSFDEISNDVCCRRSKRHPHCSWMSRGGRSLATQTTTTRTTSSAAQNMPWLLVTSTSNLQSHYLYTLTKNNSSRPASIHLKLDRGLNLPEIAINSIIGSSQGYLISIPALSDGVPLNIHAINPITGALLHIPATSADMIRVDHCKVVLSPSLDMAALVIGDDDVGFARLRSSHTFSSWKFVDGKHGNLSMESLTSQCLSSEPPVLCSSSASTS